MGVRYFQGNGNLRGVRGERRKDAGHRRAHVRAQDERVNALKVDDPEADKRRHGGCRDRTTLDHDGKQKPSGHRDVPC